MITRKQALKQLQEIRDNAKFLGIISGLQKRNRKEVDIDILRELENLRQREKILLEYINE